jgi:hypothetical protein
VHRRRPDTLTSATWDATARFRTYRLVAEAILKSLTVAWPPADAALVWHSPRAATVEDVQALAAAALAGRTPGHPAEALELLEWKKSIGLDIPEELVGDALMAHRRLCLTGDRARLAQIVRLLADTNWLIERDESDYQITAVAHRAAAVIDGPGFAGGATANLVELVDHLHSGLTVIPGALGHLARDPEGKAGSALYWTAEALLTSLVALWLASSARRVAAAATLVAVARNGRGLEGVESALAQ